MTKKTAPHIPRTINVLLFLFCTTPLDAVEKGSNILVVGRSITEAKNPEDILDKILDQIK